jgi:F-type H+-transporting ATPase subunit beta
MYFFQGFQEIINGNCDHIPESAFFMSGSIEEVKENAMKMST